MSFKDRFLDAEATFLTAVASGASPLTDFSLQWETLGTDFKRAMEQSAVDPSEVDVAYAVSSRVAILSDSFLTLENDSVSRTANFMADLDAALEDLRLEDGANGIPPVVTPACRHGQLYVADAYAWLVENIHDPYPPASLKRIWARNSRITARVMDDWFKSIRKEIGWVTLTKTHFNGSRSMAVKAAGIVFLDNGDDTAVAFEVQTEFFAVKARLENLFLEERGLEGKAFPSNSKEGSRSTSTSPGVSDAATSPRPRSPSAQSDMTSDGVFTGSSTPSSQGSFRLPSLVLDQSDSEEDERFPDIFSTTSFLDDTAIRVAGSESHGSVHERQIVRERHSCYDPFVEDSPPPWPVDLFKSPVDTHSVFLDPADLTSRSIHTLGRTALSPESLTASIDTTPTLVTPCIAEHSSASSAIGKRRREDEVPEAQAPAFKKFRAVHDLPQHSTRKHRTNAAPMPPVAANISGTLIKQPIVDWEELCNGSGTTSQTNSGDPSNLLSPIDCNVFDFDTLVSNLSTHQVPVSTMDVPSDTADNLSWDELFATAAAFEASIAEPTSLSNDEAFQELLADYTHANALLNPLSPNNPEETAISIELSPDFDFDFEAISDFSVSEPLKSPTDSTPQAIKPRVITAPHMLGNVFEPQTSEQAKDSPSFLDLLAPFSSGGPLNFDMGCFPPSLVAFS